MAARAPRPGAGARRKQNDEARRVMTITVKGEPTTIAPALLGVNDKLLVRKSVGVPFDQLWVDEDHVGEESVAVLWWMGRRKNGETFLTWDEAAAEWDAIDATDVAVSMDDPNPGADDPEA